MVFYIETFGSNQFWPQGLSSFTDMQKSFFLFLDDVNENHPTVKILGVIGKGSL